MPCYIDGQSVCNLRSLHRLLTKNRIATTASHHRMHTANIDTGSHEAFIHHTHHTHTNTHTGMHANWHTHIQTHTLADCTPTLTHTSSLTKGAY